jgi:UDP-N-acetylmuramate: L-alanyl-gamma-D-glutamyl-meso-diaminopimelate ligase
MHVHILGICGTLMGSIALLAREQGHKVTGADENVYPPMSTQLSDAGINLIDGYFDDALIKTADIIVIGNANLRRGNPAVEAVLNGEKPYTSGAEWLGRYLLKDRWVIAVAGTHGKTSTTSMIAWILDSAGLSPGFLIGGVPQNFGNSSRLGKAPFFVLEADEYDTSYFDRRSKFLHYQPRTLVLNNLEFDHADIFKDLDEIKNQFHLLLRSVPSQGLIIHPHDDPNLNALLEQGCWTPRLTTGTESISAQHLAADCSNFSIQLKGETVGEIRWPLTGEHNVRNALSAVAAARHAGVSPDIACEALSAFTGVKRRMEVLYDDSILTLYDDFAHHPTAIKTTLEGLRAQVGNEKIIAVVEPASHTMRRGTHAETLGTSSQTADETIWFQPDNIAWDMSVLANERNKIVKDHKTLIETVLERIRYRKEKIHIVIMSNGAFGGIHSKIIEGLQTY